MSRKRQTRSARPEPVKPPPQEEPLSLLRRKPQIAVFVIALAVVVCGVALFAQLRVAPVRSHIEAGINYDQSGQTEKALEEWKAAVKIDPDNRNAWNLLGHTYVSLGRWGDAVEAFRNLLRVNPKEPEIYTSLATCALQSGDETAALSYAVEALKRNPNDVGALAIAASLSPTMGDQKERLDYLRRLVKLVPDDIDFRLMLAQPLTQKLQLAEAREHVDHILTLDANNAQALAMRGFLRFTGDPSPESLKEAEADLRRSVGLAPLNAFAQFHLGRLYKQMRQPKQAIPHLAEAARLIPTRHQHFYELAEAYQQAGEVKQAALARAQFEKLRGERDRLSLLEKRVVSYPDDFDSNLEFGLLILEKGDLRKARVCLERAAKLRPGDTRAQAGLQQLAILTGGGAKTSPIAPERRTP